MAPPARAARAPARKLPPAVMEFLRRMQPLLLDAAELELPAAPVVMVVAAGVPLPDGLESVRFLDGAAVGRCTRQRAAEVAAGRSASAGRDVAAEVVPAGRALVLAVGSVGVAICHAPTRRARRPGAPSLPS